MKFLTLALVPLIVFAFVYAVGKTASWTLKKESAFRYAVYMSVCVFICMAGIAAVVLCVIYPFVTL